MKTRPHFVKSIVILSANMLLLAAFVASAADLDLSSLPLFLAKILTPNVLITVDDSFSMDNEVLTKPHWEYAAYNKAVIFMPTAEDTISGQLCEQNKKFNQYIKNPDGTKGQLNGQCDKDTDNLSTCCDFTKYICECTSSTCTDPNGDCGIWRTDGLITLPVNGAQYQNLEMRYVPYGYTSCCTSLKFPPESGCSSAVFNQACDNEVSGSCTFTNNTFSLANCTNTNGFDWRVRSAALNTMYYDPTQDYKPWSLSNLPDGDFTKAKSNPWSATIGYTMQTNLGQDPPLGRDPDPDPDCSTNDCKQGFVYYVWDKDHDAGYSGDRPHRGNHINFLSQPNGLVDFWDPHYKVIIRQDEILVKYITCNPDKTTGDLNCNTTSECSSKGNSCLPEKLGGNRSLANEQKNIANWYQYYRRLMLSTKGAVAALPDIEPNYRYGLSTINTYKPLSPSGILVDLTPPDSTTKKFDFLNHNNDLIQALFKVRAKGGPTPLREGLYRAGKYYAHENIPSMLSPNTNTLRNDPLDPSLIDNSRCMQNFVLLITDGYWTELTTGLSYLSVIGDADNDGRGGDPSDGPTLADVARYFYKNDLRPAPPAGNSSNCSLTNADPFCNDPPDPNDPDPPQGQSMITFTVAFGVLGKLVDKQPLDGWPDSIVTEKEQVWSLNDQGKPRWSDPAWGDPINGEGCKGISTACPEKINDLWHAAYNSHGAYAFAQSPADLAHALQAALAKMQPTRSTLASAAVSSGFLTTGTQTFQVLFDSSDWSGQLVANLITTDNQGHLGLSQTWDAREQLDNEMPEQRQILTFDPQQRKGIPFEWINLNPTQQGQLNISLIKGSLVKDETGKEKGAERLNFLRGKGISVQDSQWLQNNNFRTRFHKLGDIIQSDPVYVGKPIFRYNDVTTDPDLASYPGSINIQRPAMVYVGANDGMVHAFDAQTGEEKIAYIPSAVFKNLTLLTSPDYIHQYYVDGSATIGDVFYADKWHTVLVGGLRAGGQGIYALDVTDPTQFSEANAGKIVLWEFNDAQYPELGYTFSKPVIARMNNVTNGHKQWAAIVSNGYNNTQSDGSVSDGSVSKDDSNTVCEKGDAALYIVNVETGNLIRKICTGFGQDKDPLYPQSADANKRRPNGLTTPAALDTDHNFTVDYIYAGDLFGNLWKFDVRDSDPRKWKVAYKVTDNEPLFEARVPDNNGNNVPQPITTRPSIDTHPLGQGYMIYFGTGQYMENGDNSDKNQITQSFYGIWDKSELTTPSDPNSALKPLSSFTGVKSGFTGVTRNKLLQQKITVETETDNYQVRLTSNNPIQWLDAQGNPKQLGWYIDFIYQNNNNGERQVSASTIWNDKVIFNTLIPITPTSQGQQQQASCRAIDYGTSWLMILDKADGSQLETSPLDLNGDMKFDTMDLVGGVPLSGTRTTVGMSGRVPLIYTGQTLFTVLCGTKGECEEKLISPGYDDTGRQSWRQVP
jgi:type IV pilus assembly protein PilY1